VPVKVVIPGGTGQVGGLLRRAWSRAGHEVVVLSRHPDVGLEPGVRHVGWDGRTLGAWAGELDGADAVVNLAGRTVSCRYTDTNLRQMMDSRVDSARVVGSAIEAADRPPRTWLQMSTATIYADRSDEPGNPANDETTGVIGGEEKHTPLYWEYSVRIARRWEEAQAEADVPDTRRVALRAARHRVRKLQRGRHHDCGDGSTLSMTSPTTRQPSTGRGFENAVHNRRAGALPT
jgi:NAD dependent epimerase/dehydratase family enzyme